MMRRILRFLAALVSSLLLAAVVAPPATALPDWRTTGTTWTNPLARHPLVIDLRYARHSNFDRVVIDIEGRIPGWTTRYVSTHHYDGSGATVPIRAGMDLVLFPAYAHFANGTSCYTGPKLVRPGFPALKAIAFTGDFEGYVSFAFGLDGHNPYRIFRLTDPQRIVLDFRHAG
ncbi:hypothetical protein GCM10011584_20200 [Nocardioides phosphati]|uniref:AMIN-like domain-containing protein n=1 Tax=Nocardioides phosphati TaxID=1867775 RepID=A0ABQ2NAE3_9ACTN|nr:hypothetical protein [Nocardioides phosphati]GGO89827.1 hypothetical protein GCM10011584_20200 [Nocardioides phosphati]